MHFDLHPGQVIDGKYEVRYKLGQGGMGAVYLVQHLLMKREQALKLIQTEDTDGGWETSDEEFIAEMLARFMRETQTLARFAHPHIITAFDAGALEGEVMMQGAPRKVQMPFLVMEYFAGLEGKKWTFRELPTPARVLDVAKQLTSGIACAHGAGVLHRDLKPQNILIGGNDQVKIVDFGLAKPEGGEADLTRTKSSLTGTLAYMAPEYAGGSAARRSHTQATDLWALGCCLYFFLTHKNVFTQGRDENEWELIARVSRGEFTPLRDIRDDLSPEFAAIVDGLLQPDPTKRIPSAAELQRRLSLVSRADDETKPPFVPPKRKVEPPPPSSGTNLFTPPPIKISNVSPVPARDPLADLPTSGIATAGMRGIRDVVAMEAAMAAALDASSLRDAAASMGSAQPRSSSSTPGEATMLRAMEAEMNGALALAETQRKVVAPHVAPAVTAAANNGADRAVVDPPEPATPSVSVRLPAPRFQPPAGSSSKEKKAKSGLVVPALAVSTLGLMGAVLLLTVGGGESAPSTSAGTVDKAAAAQRDDEKEKAVAEQERRQLEQEARRQAADEKQRQTLIAAALANPTLAAPAVTDAPAEPAAAADAPKPHMLSSSSTPPPSTPSPTSSSTGPVAQPNSTAGDPWARYGARSTNSGSSAAAMTPAAPGAGDAAAGRRVGVRIPVRVNAELVSSPAGPVIATVTQATDIGDLTLPVGAEIHGQTSGSTATRLTMTFTTAIVNGKSIALAGTALGLDGKPGVQGARSGGDGTDVAAAAAAGAVAALGTGVATALGEDNAGGAAVRSGTAAATQNTQRLNTTQDVVTTKKGARFVVYVTR